MQPYLTFVVAARNDNYGGDFLYRMRVFLTALSALADREGLDAELVVVEWNPPKARPRLREAFDWPRTDHLAVRIIEVPEEVHRTLPNSQKMPMFEFIAKNVGIRRAAGEYVLATNPDILFDKELIAYFAAGKLRPDSFYRVDRYDVARRVPPSLDVDRQLRFCSRHAFRVHRREACVPMRNLAGLWWWLQGPLGRLAPRRLVAGLARRVAAGGRLPKAKGLDIVGCFATVHTGASGDFILMPRRQWHELRGFPELSTSAAIDTFMVVTAAVSGLNPILLPFPIYHQEHDRSELAARPPTRLDQDPDFMRMYSTRQPVIRNDEKWGLGGLELPECAVVPSGAREPVGTQG